MGRLRLKSSRATAGEAKDGAAGGGSGSKPGGMRLIPCTSRDSSTAGSSQGASSALTSTFPADLLLFYAVACN